MTLKYEYDLRGLHYLVRVGDRVLKPFDIYVDGRIVEHGAGKIEVKRLEEIYVNINCENDLILKAYTTEKPPLGVKPLSLVIECRISDLIGAIDRQIMSNKPKYGLVKKWANEIMNLCDVIEKDIPYDNV